MRLGQLKNVCVILSEQEHAHISYYNHICQIMLFSTANGGYDIAFNYKKLFYKAYTGTVRFM